MIDLNPLSSISREIREWMDKRERGREARDQQTRSALKSLSVAVLETRTYIGNLRSVDVSRDFEKEGELSTLWNEAHIDLQKVDSLLAERCFAKAEYWSDPSSWEPEKVRQYNITLDSMSDAVRGFLARTHEQ